MMICKHMHARKELIIFNEKQLYDCQLSQQTCELEWESMSRLAVDLRSFIQSLQVLNYNKHISNVCHVDDLLRELGDGSFVVSDCDPELLILIEFDREVCVNSVRFHAASSTIHSNRPFLISQPRHVRIHKTNDVSVNFSDIKRMRPDVSQECDAKQLEQGQTVTCNLLSVRNLVIFVQTNQDDTVRSFLNAVVILGSAQLQQIECVHAFCVCLIVPSHVCPFAYLQSRRPESG